MAPAQTGAAGGGDKSGHSSYHAVVLKLDKRFSRGFAARGSYVLSKPIADADSYNAGNAAMDHYNRSLEKSIGQYDQTHNLKASYVWEMPFGRGRRWLTKGVGAGVLGDWRFSGVHLAQSGTPPELEYSNQYYINQRGGASAMAAPDGSSVMPAPTSRATRTAAGKVEKIITRSMAGKRDDRAPPSFRDTATARIFVPAPGFPRSIHPAGSLDSWSRNAVRAAGPASPVSSK